MNMENSVIKEAAALVGRIETCYRTRDVYELARRAGVTLVFQHWPPVTAGEFDHRTKTIYVNGNAPLPVEKIVAHELGHYFLRRFEIGFAGDEERFCDEFAAALLKGQ